METIDEKVFEAIRKRVENESFARKFGMTLSDLGPGTSRIEMRVTGEMENIFNMTHGGALFALIDEAFETAVNSWGTVAVALSMNVNFFRPTAAGNRLVAEARMISQSRRTGTYEIKVFDEEERLIAFCSALAYRKGDPLPFL